jgi:hypothetical protein
MRLISWTLRSGSEHCIVFELLLVHVLQFYPCCNVVSSFPVVSAIYDGFFISYITDFYPLFIFLTSKSLRFVSNFLTFLLFSSLHHCPSDFSSTHHFAPYVQFIVVDACSSLLYSIRCMPLPLCSSRCLSSLLYGDLTQDRPWDHSRDGGGHLDLLLLDLLHLLLNQLVVVGVLLVLLDHRH